MFKKKQSLGRIHPAWTVFVACCLVYSSIQGMMINCRGVYFVEASKTLGVTAGVYGSYMIYYGLTSALAFPLTVQLLRRGNFKIVLSIFVTVFCVTTILMGQVQDISQCYFIACLQGASGGVLSLYLLPYLIKNWFYKRQGTVLGISTMFAGIVGAVMNPVIQYVIARFGWRLSYTLVGSVIWIISIPAILLFLYRQPSDIGMQPLGFDGESVEEKTSAIIEQKPWDKRFLAVCVFVICVVWSSTVSYTQQISGYSVSIHISAAGGALAVSCSMVGNVCGKFFCGILNDKIGVFKTSIIFVLLIVGSFGFLTLGSILPWVLYIGAFLNGISMPLLSVQIPLFVGIVYKSKGEYERKYTYVCMMNSFISVAGSGMIGRLYDVLGSYYYSFSVSCVMLIVSIMLVMNCKKYLE